MSSYHWAPKIPYRFVLKKGMTGFEVAALQLNLGIDVDGDFGDKTKEVVAAWQKSKNLIVDGIAGGQTQMSLCVQLSTPATRTYNLPGGLLRSIVASECGGYIGAIGPHPSDSGYDIGPYMISTGSSELQTQEFYENAFNITHTSQVVADRARDFHDGMPNPVPSKYLIELADGDTDVFRWQMTVLNHNWPAAAHHIPRRGSVYSTPGTDDQPQQWIITATGGRLETPREWVHFQVEKKTVYVRW